MKYLIAGLGNIGQEYDGTRHNIGFQVLDEFAEIQGVQFKLERLAFYAETRIKGRSVHLIKPTTFMNRSGRSLRFWMNKYDIPFENVLVIVDDLALPFGKIRLKSKGSHGGHNGLRDIIQETGRSDFARLRFGIGDGFSKGRQVQYVLSGWDDDELMALPEKIKDSAEFIKSFVSIGVDRTMNFLN